MNEGDREHERARRVLCWDSEKFDRFKIPLPAQGSLTNWRQLQWPRAPFWYRHYCFSLSWRDFRVPTPVRQAVIGHGTFCSVSLDDLHMCSWKKFQKPPGESRSLGYLRKLLGIFSGISACSLRLSFLHWGQMLSHFTSEKHALPKILVGKGQPWEVTSALGVESKISLFPVQIISSKAHWRIAYPCKISEWSVL